MQGCLFVILFITFLAANINGLEEDKRVGSRGLWVSERSSFLELRLRKCVCTTYTANKLCICWNNHNRDDQPAVQGSPTRIVSAFLNYFNVKHLDQETTEQTVNLPNQQMLLKLFKAANVEIFFYFLEDNKAVDYKKFLELISQEKFPIAGVENSDNCLKYQMYFHDVFNHAGLWLNLPTQYRELIANKVKSFLIFSQYMEKELKGEVIELYNIWQLVKSFLALSIDTSSGSFNNLLFSDNQWWEITSFNEKDKLKLIELIEKFFNLGITLPITEERPCAIIDEQNSPIYLVLRYLDFVRIVLNDYHNNQIKLLEDYPSLREEKILQELIYLSGDDVEKYINMLKDKVKVISPKFGNYESEHQLSLNIFFSLLSNQRDAIKMEIEKNIN